MKYFILLLATFSFSVLNAQLASDALRYSNLDFGSSTARSLGVGGSLGALGADYSVLSTNPAGLGMYRRSEFVLTPAVFATKTESDLLGTNNVQNRSETDFNLANIGAVFVSQPRLSKWTTFNFGIGLNRLTNFDQEFFYEGETPSTITDRFLDIANDTGPDAFEAGVAEDAEAIFFDEPSGLYFSDYSDLSLGFLINKSQTVERSGSLNELVFSFAGNYDEKLIVGLTVGVPFLTFTELKVYQEFVDESSFASTPDVEPFSTNLQYTERLTTNGVGINAKLGLIYRLSQMLRLGAAVHTPTNFGMDDLFSTDLTYMLRSSNQNISNGGTSPNGVFDYRLKTPWRYFANAGLIIGKSGFVSAEVEYVNYAKNEFDLTAESNSPEDQAFQEQLNEQIGEDFQSAVNIRIGGEWAVNQFRLRGGYQVRTSALADTDGGLGIFSLGAGFRGERVFLDLGYQRGTTENSYSPYLTSFANEPIVDNNLTISRYLLTIGYKF